jgi:hypothetical protein
MTRTLPLLSLAVTVLAAAPALAAGKRIAVLEFEGAAGQRRPAQIAVARVLRGENTVIPRAQLQARLGELGLAPRCGREELVGIASAVGAEAVLCGKLSGRNTLIVEVYNGGDGKLLRIVRLRIGPQGISRAALEKLATKVGPALATAWSWTAVESRRGRAPRAVVNDRTALASLPELGGWDSDPTGPDGSDGENPLASRRRRAAEASIARRPSAAARPEGEHALRLGVGAAMLVRRNFRTYGATAQRDAQSWQTSPAGGLVVSAELFPAAWLTRGWASHLGIGASFERYFGPSWRFSTSSADQASSHQVISVDVRGRFAFWKSPRALEAMLRVGFRRVDTLMNAVDRAALIPDTSIIGLETGLALQLPILPRWLYLSASFDYLTIFDRGDIASAAQYGPASGGGLLFGGGLRGEIYRGFGWQLDVGYSWYAHTFDPSWGADRTAEAANDRYLTTQLQLTYRN